jgi:hypothetical protein
MTETLLAGVVCSIEGDKGLGMEGTGIGIAGGFVGGVTVVGGARLENENGQLGWEVQHSVKDSWKELFVLANWHWLLAHGNQENVSEEGRHLF